MKKTVSINLSGLLFTIDEDAYIVLKSYLEKIETHFSNEPDTENIIQDIESRIAELFIERTSSSKQVITLADIQEVIKIMGEPFEFEAQDPDYGKREATTSSQGRKYRKLYRDPDNEWIGGVATGLAAYFALDPSIIRIVFIILALAGGTGIIAYLIFWIVVPEATTAAQKLEMRGNPVTASSIGDFFKEEFENVKKNFKGNKKNKK